MVFAESHMSTVLQELMQEGFIYRTTVADSFQIIDPILQTIRSSCEIRAEVLIIDVRLELRIHKLDGCMMYLDLTDVLEALVVDLVSVTLTCRCIWNQNQDPWWICRCDDG
jgi:hypothetical protein